VSWLIDKFALTGCAIYFIVSGFSIRGQHETICIFDRVCTTQYAALDAFCPLHKILICQHFSRLIPQDGERASRFLPLLVPRRTNRVSCFFYLHIFIYLPYNRRKINDTAKIHYSDFVSAGLQPFSMSHSMSDSLCELNREQVANIAVMVFFYKMRI